MPPLFGHTRTRVAPRHALITPDSHVPSNHPGVTGARAIILISPALGANLIQMNLEFGDTPGHATFDQPHLQTFLLVLHGSCAITCGERRERLTPGGFAYLPAGAPGELTAPEPSTRLALFQKTYQPLPGHDTPPPAFGNTAEIPGLPFLGNPSARLQTLLPDDLRHDFAVNLFTYQPGATLPFVETHIMEHGLLMLTGQGIYRLEENHYPVQAGDAIWMAPYCPQWFVAMGDTPASYLYCKDINRHP